MHCLCCLFGLERLWCSHRIPVSDLRFWVKADCLKGYATKDVQNKQNLTHGLWVAWMTNHKYFFTVVTSGKFHVTCCLTIPMHSTVAYLLHSHGPWHWNNFVRVTYKDSVTASVTASIACTVFQSVISRDWHYSAHWHHCKMVRCDERKPCCGSH